MASCPVLSILQGFSHVPKRPGGLKPELIDVDLVIGTVCFSFFRLKRIHIYLTVILRGCAGYELIYITNEAVGGLLYKL